MSRRRTRAGSAGEPPPRPDGSSPLVRYVPYAIVAVLCALLAIRLFAAMGPATRHELASFCLPLKPDPGNDTLGALPVPAPAIEALDVNNVRRSLSAYRGKVVLVHFWATWCPPCREEMPGLVKLAEALKGNPDITILAIANDRSWSDVTAFFRSIGVTSTPMTLMLDPDGEAMHAFGTSKLPETYLVDPKGVVRDYFISERDFGDPKAEDCLESLR